MSNLEPHVKRKVRRAILEKTRREMEALRVYEPYGEATKFHESWLDERIIRGSNRSGKTTPAAVELARAVTNQDPYNKYPQTEGRAFLVAKSETEIGEVFYRKLFRKGAFKMIKDPKTGKWRTYRPWKGIHPDYPDMGEGDGPDAEGVRPSQPLIPRRFINQISWKDKKKHVPNVVRLVNGWEISFFTAGSTPPHGMDLDYIWFDEEVTGADWYAEMSARLVDRKGVFVWSATPQNGTEDLFDLHERAIDPEEPDVGEFYVTLAANPYIPQRDKDKLARKYANKPEEYKVRILGEFAVRSWQVYPLFSMSRELHGCEPFEMDDSWNRYMVVDPGRQVCAVAFFAVPPPKYPYSGCRYLYDELYIHDCTAIKFARTVQKHIGTQQFMEFIIDPAAFRCEVGSGLSVAGQYSHELQRKNIKSHFTGYNFTPGVNERTAGIEKLGAWMDIDPGMSRPVLQVFEGGCPWFEWEIKRYRRRRESGVITDKTTDRNDHMMDACRYFAMRDPQWRENPEEEKIRNPVIRYLEQREEEERMRGGKPYISMGPRGGAAKDYV